MQNSLFDKYGGFSNISRIVMALYDRLLDDDDVGPFFGEVDLPELIDHQTKFISALMGGPASFSDGHIQRAHAHMIVSDAHFDQLKSLVRETLEEFEIEPEDIEAVLGEFEVRRPLLVGTGHVD